MEISRYPLTYFYNHYRKFSERLTELKQIIMEYFGADNFEESLAIRASELPVLMENEEHFQQHGEKVVEIINLRGGIEAVKDFEVSWRQHFLDIMDPKAGMTIPTNYNNRRH